MKAGRARHRFRYVGGAERAVRRRFHAVFGFDGVGGVAVAPGEQVLVDSRLEARAFFQERGEFGALAFDEAFQPRVFRLARPTSMRSFSVENLRYATFES